MFSASCFFLWGFTSFTYFTTEVFFHATFLSLFLKNKLFFVDVPMAVVSFGRSLNPKNILEGADVYFECHVKSNPPFYNITWRNNVSIIKNG